MTTKDPIEITFELRPLTVRLKYYPDGIETDSMMICDFCKRNLEPSLIPKSIHFLLCEECRRNFNRKLTEDSSLIVKSSMGIAMFDGMEIKK